MPSLTPGGMFDYIEGPVGDVIEPLRQFQREVELAVLAASGGTGTGLSDPGADGILVRDALGHTLARTLIQPAAGLTISNSNGTTGNPTFALADDLAAVEAIITTGFVKRTAANTWVTVTGISDSDLSANVALKNAANVFTANNTFDHIGLLNTAPNSLNGLTINNTALPLGSTGFNINIGGGGASGFSGFYGGIIAVTYNGTGDLPEHPNATGLQIIANNNATAGRVDYLQAMTIQSIANTPAYPTAYTEIVYGLYNTFGAIGSSGIGGALGYLANMIFSGTANSATSSAINVGFRSRVTKSSTGSVPYVAGFSLEGWSATGGAPGTSYGIYADSTIDIGTARYFILSNSASLSQFAGDITVQKTSATITSKTTTNSGAFLKVVNDLGSTGNVVIYGSGGTGSSIVTMLDTMTVYSFAAGGTNVGAAHGSGEVRFYTGGFNPATQLRWTINAAGHLVGNTGLDFTVRGLLKTGTVPTTLTNAGGQVLVSVINTASIGFPFIPRAGGGNLFEASQMQDDGSDVTIDAANYLNLNAARDVNLTSGIDVIVTASNNLTLSASGLITLRDTFSDVIIGDDSGLGGGIKLTVSNSTGAIYVSGNVLPDFAGQEIGGPTNQGWSSVWIASGGNRSIQLTGTASSTDKTATFPNANTFISIASQVLTFSGMTAARTITLPDANTTVPLATQLITFTGVTAGRTVTLPDANTSVPLATQILTLTGPTAPRTITLYNADFSVARINDINTFVNAQTFSTSISVPLINAAADVTMSPVGSVVMNAGSKIVQPLTGYDQNLGQLSRKWLTLHAAELWVETLVAQSTIATIGGRILVGPTTTLTADITTGSSSIIVKHNQMQNGDRVMLEANGSFEMMAITSGPSGTGPYTYTVTRNIDGTGPNAWTAGDAVFNTGTAGNGFLDIYSFSTQRSAAQIALGAPGIPVGPTIVGNVRNSTTFNDWTEHWAIGNLTGLYGYGSNVYGVALGQYAAGKSHLTVDSTFGIRIFNGVSTVIGQWDIAGVITVGQVAASKSNIVISSGALDLRVDTAIRTHLATDGSGYFANTLFAFDTAGNVTISGNATIAGWTVNSVYFAKDTGTNATSSGMAPVDFPFFAGATYANRATAVFRVTPAGALTATSATITGSITATSGDIAGWAIAATSLSKNEVKIAAGVNANLVAGTGEAWFGKSAAGYYGLIAKGTTAANLQILAGNSAIGSAGRPYISINDGTRYRIVLGELNTTTWDGVATNSMGMKIWDSAGGKIIEFSDIQNIIAGLTISTTKIFTGTGTFNNTNTAFYVDNTGQLSLKDKLSWDGSTLVMHGGGIITGTISASSLRIGNFDNLVEDPGLERGGSTWVLGGGWSVVNSAPSARSGNFYLSNNSTTGTYALNAVFADCKPGDKFYAECYGKTSGTGGVAVVIDWLDINKAHLSYSQGSTTAGGSYTISTVTATAPASTAYARIGATVPGGIAGWFADDFYFRRMVEGSIVVDGTITAIKLFVSSLQTITATMGALTVDDKLTMNGASSAITIGDPAIAAIPTNATTGTGIWIDKTGMTGLLTNVVQAKFDGATGKITAGAGVVKLNVSGIGIESSSALADLRSYQMTDTSGVVLASLGTRYDVNNAVTQLIVNPLASRDSILYLVADCATGRTTEINLRTRENGGDKAHLQISSTGAVVQIGNLSTNNGVVVGRMTGSTTTGTSYPLQVNRDSTGTPAIGFGAGLWFFLKSATVSQRDAAFLFTEWSTATDASRTSVLRFQVVNSAAAAADVFRLAPGTSGVRFSQYGAGALSTDASGNITAASDRRMKDIESRYTKGLEAILNIRPVVFKWKRETNLDTTTSYIGFIAQEVQEEIREAVNAGPDGMLGLQDRGITAALVNSVKELSSIQDNKYVEFTALKIEVDSLKAEVASLRKQLAKK